MVDITLTAEQYQCVKAIKKWFTNKPESRFPFIMAGLAGVGKTSIVKHITFDLGLKDYQIRYASFTGKAALIMRKKGMDASTIHSLIYEPRVDKNKKVHFVKKNSLGTDVKLIVIDEASMISKTLQTDLESFGISILYVGDHKQLPPVSNDTTNLMLNPNFKLETIHRQALHNPIIFIADMARRGKFIPFGKFGTTVLKCHAEKVGVESLKNANQIICGKNNTRRNINSQMRDYYGFKSIFPEPNDRLICLKNNSQNGLINGMTGTCINFNESTFNLDFTCDEGDEYYNLTVDYNIFRGTPNDKYLKMIDSFDFSYAVTCHKAQGSQYDNVILYEERMGDQDFHNRWLYTGITRSSEKLIIIA